MVSRLLRPLARALWKFHLHRKDFVAPQKLLLGLALLLCTAPCIRADNVAKRVTLRNSRDLPVRDIQQALPDEAWELIKDRAYVAYVILDGSVDRKGYVQVQEPLRCHPDESWMKHVPAAMKDVRFKTAGVVPSQAITRVKTCIVFYPAPTGYTALVFAAQDILFFDMAIPHTYAGLASIEIPAKDRKTK